MKHLTVGKRITIGFSLILCILLALSGFTLHQMALIKQQYNQVSQQAVPALQRLAAVQTRVQTILSCVYKHISSPNAADMDQIEATMAEISKNNGLDIEVYGKLISSTAEASLFETLKTTRANYLRLQQEFLKASRAATNTEASAQLYARARKEFDPVAADYTALLTKLANEKSQAVAQATTTTSEAIRFGNIGVSVGSIIALVLGILMAVVIIRAVTRALRNLSDALNEASTQVSAAAGQVSSSSQSLAEGASEQAASLEETSSSLEEMSSMTKRNAENAQKANELAQEASSAAERGAAGTRDMSQAMTAIKTSSDEIAKILKNIDEIAFQTNILALNAAVEAARAGEAGMGFAVVADEVRNLAQRCAHSAKETAVKIDAAVNRTAQGVAIAEKVGKALDEIVDKAQQVNILVAEVANASHEQNTGITQINLAVGQMDKVTQSNAANAEECASSAEELNAQSAAMKEAVVELLLLVGGASQHTPSENIPYSGLRQVTAVKSTRLKTPKIGTSH